jgi:predicted DsbA family dithiol-disulfide isomerase
VVFKNMVVHPQYVTDAHNAGCAAAKQGKFVEYKRAFWDKAFGPYSAQHDPSKLGVDNIMAIAKDIGLDTAKLKADMDGPDCKAYVQADMAELAKFHVNSTPTFFINGKHLNGAMPKEGFKQVIDQQLKVAEASGVSGASYYDKEIMGKGAKQFRSKMDAGK